MGSLINLVGKQFGRWTVIGRAENKKRWEPYWLCVCSCGTKRAVLGLSLRRGESKSCGCLAHEQKLIDMAGKRCGRLVVVEQAESPHAKRRESYWKCRCDCGNSVIVGGVSLRSGKTQSCGCLARDTTRSLFKGVPNLTRRLPKGEAAFNRMLSGMKRSAKERGHEWSLTKEQVRILTQQPCRYCGIEPQQVAGRQGYNGLYIYNGLDRIDPARGYFLENVAPCCGACNYAKRSMTLDEFKAWILRVYEHLHLSRPALPALVPRLLVPSAAECTLRNLDPGNL